MLVPEPHQMGARFREPRPREPKEGSYDFENCNL